MVDASRDLFLGTYATGTVFWGAVVTFALATLLAWWGTRTFQKLSA